jgi:hypothetical protein
MARWRTLLVGSLGGLLFLLPAGAGAHGLPRPEPGSLVSVSVQVDGREAPLYPAPDRSGRYYLEAREGAHYLVRMQNRTGRRLGVSLIVDGLNAVSGERAEPWSRPGRMYVLGPWDQTSVRGWRSSLDEVRRFRFVDERVSYSARAGQANEKMGWIEVAVFRERQPYVARPWWDEGWLRREGRSSEAPPASVPPPAAAPEAEARDRAESARAEDLRALGYSDGGAARKSYPGTGWGERSYDPVRVVDFQPEARPAEVVTLRYEYAPALRALGISPHRRADRLSERDGGFAPPPAW